MVASSSRWNPYWPLVAQCSATRERADRRRVPVSVAIILLQTAVSRIGFRFASEAGNAISYILLSTIGTTGTPESRAVQGVKAMPAQRPDGIDSRVCSAANR